MTESKQPIDSHAQSEHEPKKPEINKYFEAAIKAQASDLHLKVGQSPKVRVHKGIKSTTGTALTEKKMEELVFEILDEKQKHFFLENGVLDFAYEVGSDNRFRVNIFRQMTKISLVARRMTSQIPAFETLHLPPIVEKISDMVREGIILVTGPTGSGKSTTIASMIDHINRTRSCHIVTIEDPLEFVHTDKKAIVSQREIGIDVPDYESALQSLIRQDPDVVLVSEIRDSQTLTAAMRAAEMGRLVFGTLQASSAPQTIQRVLDLYPQNERDMARQAFASAFKAIICQVLLPGLKKEVPRVPMLEILISNPIVKKIISEKREADLDSVIKTGHNEGMLDFTTSLCKLVDDEWIDLKVALQFAPNVEELKMTLKGIRASARSVS